MSPRFWDRPPDRPGFLARALTPVAGLRRSGGTAAIPPQPLPVLRIGTARASDLGLPLAAAAAMALDRPHILWPGPGAPRRLDPAQDETGTLDAAVSVLAAFAPVWTGGAPAELVGAAARAGAGSVILLSNDPTTGVALAITIVGARRGFGNGRARPAGPLHMELDRILSFSDAIVVVGQPREADRFTRRWAISTPLIQARLIGLTTGMDWTGLRVLAFASGEAPEAFFAALGEQGANLTHTIAIDGAHDLAPGLLGRLNRDAAARGAQLVTTEHDAARLPKAVRGKVLSLPLRLAFEEDALGALFRTRGLCPR